MNVINMKLNARYISIKLWKQHWGNDMEEILGGNIRLWKINAKLLENNNKIQKTCNFLHYNRN